MDRVNPKIAKTSNLNLLTKDGSYYDGAFLPKKNRIFFSETSKSLIYELTTQNLVRSARVKGSSIPNKTIRVSRNEDCLILNEDNVLRVFRVTPRGLRDTNVRIDFAKNNGLTIEDFVCLGSNKIAVGHSGGLLVIVLYDYVNVNWLKLYEINLNDGKDDKEKLEITCLAADKRGGFLAISTTDLNYPNDNKLRQILLFRVLKKYNLELYAIRDYGFNCPKNSYYSHLCFDYVSSRLPVILAFQGGAGYNLDAYIVTKHNTLDLIHSVRGYHKNDFSAIRSLGRKVFSVDFDGNMNILEVGQ